MTEKLNEQLGQNIDKEQLEAIASELGNETEKRLEAAAEKAPEQNAEKLTETAEKLAEANEKEAKKEVSPAEKRKDTPPKVSKSSRKAAFDTTMKDAQEHMSAPARSFSKLIHTQAVEKASETLGATVARPNALLAGSVSAFVLTLVVYLVAKYYGYPLTGTESIAAFVFGWIIGIIFDYLRVMITGKRGL
jgi:hypothetical protein